MAFIRDTRNVVWTVSIAVAVIMIFAIEIWIAITVDRRLNPQGAPLALNQVTVVTDAPAIGHYFRTVIDVTKRRDCEPHAQMVWINSVGEERPFLIETWPYVNPGAGDRKIDLWAQVPEVLAPGKFKLQVRGLWRCQEDYYPVTSPTTELEIVKAQAGP